MNVLSPSAMICTRDFLTAILYRPTKTLASFSTAKGSRINRLASFLLMPAPISIFNALFRFMPSPPSQRLAHGKQCLGESVCGNAIIEKAARESSNGIENLLTAKVCFVCSEIAVAGCLVPHQPVCAVAAISASHQQLNCAFSRHGSIPLSIFTPQCGQYGIPRISSLAMVPLSVLKLKSVQQFEHSVYGLPVAVWRKIHCPLALGATSAAGSVTMSQRIRSSIEFCAGLVFAHRCFCIARKASSLRI